MSPFLYSLLLFFEAPNFMNSAIETFGVLL
jgi:hypothetical protein